MTDTPNGGGWSRDELVKLHIMTNRGIVEDAFALAEKNGHGSISQLFEAFVTGAAPALQIAEALARIEAKLNALDKSPQVLSGDIDILTKTADALRAGFFSPEQREAARKEREASNARMAPHGTDMRPDAITWVEDDGA